MKTKSSAILIMLVVLSLALGACNDNKSQADKKDVETINSGKLTVYCEDALVDLLDTTFTLYRKLYPEVELTVIPANSREVMSQLLSAQARVVIVARDYLHDEDSLMAQYKVAKHAVEEIADDALCLFVNRESTLDTLNADEVFNVLTNAKKNFKDYYPKLPSEPEIAICDQNSSMYSNMKKLAAKGKPIMRKLKLFSTVDSVRNFVKNTPNSIGITYLHHVIRNLDFKTIPIGYHDSTGKYITPKPVHQAYIIQGLYPYTVTFKAMFLEDFKNLPFWFGAFVAREAIITKYLKDAGVVPKFAKFTLINED